MKWWGYLYPAMAVEEFSRKVIKQRKKYNSQVKGEKVISKGIHVAGLIECSTETDFDCHLVSDPLIELSCTFINFTYLRFPRWKILFVLICQQHLKLSTTPSLLKHLLFSSSFLSHCHSLPSNFG